MPSYVIEFDSNHGPERRLFTLDDDRSLEIQLYQVLEELRQSGRMLQGAPGDELAVSWNGAELTLQSPLHTLGVDGARPLVLYMRPRRVEVVATPTPAVAPFGLRHMVLPPIEGALGALAAWGMAGLFTDLTPPLATVDRVDMVVAVLLTGGIGVALSVGSVWRGLCRAPVALLCALLCAVAGGLAMVGIGMVGEMPSNREFLLSRVVTWLLMAMPVAIVVSAPLRATGGQRFAEAAAVGLCAGLLGALVASLPGVSDLWQALAFILCGALVGAAAISVPIWRTLATMAPPAPRVTPAGAAVRA